MVSYTIKLLITAHIYYAFVVLIYNVRAERAHLHHFGLF